MRVDGERERRGERKRGKRRKETENSRRKGTGGTVERGRKEREEMEHYNEAGKPPQGVWGAQPPKVQDARAQPPGIFRSGLERPLGKACVPLVYTADMS